MTTSTTTAPTPPVSPPSTPRMKESTTTTSTTLGGGDGGMMVNNTNVSEYLQSELDEMNHSFSEMGSDVVRRMSNMMKKMDDLERSTYMMCFV